VGLNRSVKYLVVLEDFLLGRSLCREGEGDKFPAIFGRMQEKNRSRMLSVLKSSVAQIVAMLHEEQRLSVQRSLPWLQNSKVICVADERAPKESHRQHTIHHLRSIAFLHSQALQKESDEKHDPPPARPAAEA